MSWLRFKGLLLVNLRLSKMAENALLNELSLASVHPHLRLPPATIFGTEAEPEPIADAEEQVESPSDVDDDNVEPEQKMDLPGSATDVPSLQSATEEDTKHQSTPTAKRHKTRSALPIEVTI